MFSTTVEGSMFGTVSAEPNWKGVAGGGGGTVWRLAAAVADSATVGELAGGTAALVGGLMGACSPGRVVWSAGWPVGGACDVGLRRTNTSPTETHTRARMRAVFPL